MQLPYCGGFDSVLKTPENARVGRPVDGGDGAERLQPGEQPVRLAEGDAFRFNSDQARDVRVKVDADLL